MSNAHRGTKTGGKMGSKHDMKGKKAIDTSDLISFRYERQVSDPLEQRGSSRKAYSRSSSSYVSKAQFVQAK